jgi:two-component system, NarL family, sensor histidine kinase DesK
MIHLEWKRLVCQELEMKSLKGEQAQSISNKYWMTTSDGDGSKLREIIAASGISVRLWRLYAYFWLICLFFPILSIIQTPPPGLGLPVTIVGLITFVVTYLRVMWPHPLDEGRRARFRLQKSVTLITGLTVLVLFLSIKYGSSFLWLFVGVSAIAGLILSFHNASIAVFGLTLLTLGFSIYAGGSIAFANWFQIIPLVLLVRGLGLDMIGFVRLSHALRELHSAREELARQAVMEERLRMARDLHDLLGHTLSLITLKSELAGRLLEKDPYTASQEVHEIERIARQALREVREAVAGYRQRTLHGELDGARQILEAAGIVFTVEDETQSLPPTTDAVLAWVVREGVTNVIRHSRAQHCVIRIKSTDEYVRVEVINDGRPREENSKAQPGSGLSGLAERVAELEGRIETGASSLTGIGYQLKVEIPTGEGLTVEER